MSGASTVSSVAYLSDYRPEVDTLRAEVDRLRALVLVMSDAIDLTRQSGDDTARTLADERYAAGWLAGYEAGARTLAAEWPALVKAAIAGGPALAELNARRSVSTGRTRDHDRTGDEIRSDAAASWAAGGDF